MAKPFTKPALPPPALIALMRGRGLTVADPFSTTRHLRNIGYYRLTGYMLPFQKGGAGADRHNFTSGTTFEQIIDLYTFNRQLRVLLLDVLERIEIAIKAALNNSVALRHGPHWFLKPCLFKASCNHSSLLDSIKEEIGHNDPQKRSIAVQHYYTTYCDPQMPPAWMVLEVISFGKLAYIIRNLGRGELKALSHTIGISDVSLTSWCLALSYLRNLCAHHARVWNRKMTIKPHVSNDYRADMTPNDRVYAQLVVTQALMKIVSPGSKWQSRLQALFEEYPNISPTALGFPPDWVDRSLWK